MLQEIIRTWSILFFRWKTYHSIVRLHVFFLHFFLGTSTVPTVATADKVEQLPSAVPESVCQTYPKTMQLHIEEAAGTSARGKGKILGKRMILKSHAELVQVQHAVIHYSFTINFYFSLFYEIKCCTLQLLHQFTESLMVSIIIIVIRMPWWMPILISSNFNFVLQVVISLLYIALLQ